MYRSKETVIVRKTRSTNTDEEALTPTPTDYKRTKTQNPVFFNTTIPNKSLLRESISDQILCKWVAFRNADVWSEE